MPEHIELLEQPPNLSIEQVEFSKVGAHGDVNISPNRFALVELLLHPRPEFLAVNSNISKTIHLLRVHHNRIMRYVAPYIHIERTSTIRFDELDCRIEQLLVPTAVPRSAGANDFDLVDAVIAVSWLLAP